MAKPPTMTFDFSPHAAMHRKDPEDPLRILLLGNFSGESAGSADVPLQHRKPVFVDIDNFDSVIERLSPSISLPLPGGERGAPVVFEELEDFHPDALFRRVETFATLRGTRKKLMNPATFQEALRELNMPSSEPQNHSAADSPAQEDNASAFEHLLGGTAANPEATAARATNRTVESLVASLVAPYIEPGTDPRQDQYAGIVDTAISELMRALLHAPGFQRLEARWRAVHELITSVETGEELKIYLLDVTRAELQADLCASGVSPNETGLYRQLVEQNRQTAGGAPWSLLVADGYFGPAPDDVSLLAALGALGAQAGGPVLAGAKPAAFGCASVWSQPDPRQWQPLDDEEQALWSALRQSPMARWIGLAAPRIMARVPYGTRRDEIDAFAFEETPDDAEGEQYLWGNPAFALAALIAQGFGERGWELIPGQQLEVRDLPAVSVTEQGESTLVPCAEALLSEPAASAIAAQGIMPVLSHASANLVRFAGVHSIALPEAPLAGAWSDD